MSKGEIEVLGTVTIAPQEIEMAIGGAYKMPDGREFWIDAPVAREMTSRVLAALRQASQKGNERG